PLPPRDGSALRQRPRLPDPARRKRGSVNDGELRRNRRDGAEDLPSRIVRPVVDGDDFEIRMASREQRTNAALDLTLLVSSGNDDREARQPAVRLARFDARTRAQNDVERPHRPEQVRNDEEGRKGEKQSGYRRCAARKMRSRNFEGRAARTVPAFAEPIR